MRRASRWRRCLGAEPEEIVFTSGGTESDNLAILGASGGHVITTTVEHPAVLGGGGATAITARAGGLARHGRSGRDPAGRCSRDTKLISVMHANNEIGAIQPIAEIARIACGGGRSVHSDGVQAAGKIPVNVAASASRCIRSAAHKIGAPKGIGALYVRKGTKLKPMLYGGQHERERRAGTENVAGAVALARAVEWMAEHGARRIASRCAAGSAWSKAVLERIPDTHVNGAGAAEGANTTNIRFDGIDSDALLIALDLKGFAVSSGAACSSGAPEPSHVLLAMGLTREQARSSIRFSLGRSNTEEQVDALVEAVGECVAHLAKAVPVLMPEADHLRVAAMSGRRGQLRRRGDAARARRQRGRADDAALEPAPVAGDRRATGATGAAARSTTCTMRARGAASGHPLLRGQFRAALRGAGGQAVRRGVSRRAHADPLHAVQQLHQVRSVSGNGRQASAPSASPPATTRGFGTMRTPGAGKCCASVDRSKDQTYFLFGLTQEQLARTMFPLGGMDKPRCANSPAKLGIPTAAKPDSQEICFVPNGDYAAFIDGVFQGAGNRSAGSRRRVRDRRTARWSASMQAFITSRSASGAAGGRGGRAVVRDRDRSGHAARDDWRAMKSCCGRRCASRT